MKFIDGNKYGRAFKRAVTDTSSLLFWTAVAAAAGGSVFGNLRPAFTPVQALVAFAAIPPLAVAVGRFLKRDDTIALSGPDGERKIYNIAGKGSKVRFLQKTAKLIQRMIRTERFEPKLSKETKAAIDLYVADAEKILPDVAVHDCTTGEKLSTVFFGRSYRSGKGEAHEVIGVAKVSAGKTRALGR